MPAPATCLVLVKNLGDWELGAKDLKSLMGLQRGRKVVLMEAAAISFAVVGKRSDL